MSIVRRGTTVLVRVLAPLLVAGLVTPATAAATSAAAEAGSAEATTTAGSAETAAAALDAAAVAGSPQAATSEAAVAAGSAQAAETAGSAQAATAGATRAAGSAEATTATAATAGAEAMAGAQADPGADRPPRYTATEVTGPNGEALDPRLLNEQGQVVAQVNQLAVPDPERVVVFWQRGRARFVEPEGANASESDLSDRGQVVGSADGHAFSWQDGKWRLLSASAGSEGAAAQAVNNRGQVVGLRYPGPEVVVWHGGQVTVAPIAGVNALPLDINERGQVLIATVSPERTPGALVWQVGGGVTDLGSLGGGGEDTVPAAINDRGQVVGTSVAADGRAHPFLWEDGRMTDLGAPLGGAAGYAVAQAVAVNEHGDVVGWSTADGPGGRVEIRGLLWRGGERIDLGTLGGPLTQPLAINDRGQVVGFSEGADGRAHPFLWEDGRLTDLSSFVDDPALNPYGQALRINDRGQILGTLTSTAPSGAEVAHAVLWTPRRP